jgi:hypothetical protein
MNRWSVFGIVMVLVGLAILVAMWGFIVTVLVTLLQLIAVAIGIILVVGGVAAILFGGRFRRRVFWGPAPTKT